jgi:hypothetical protein
MAPHCGGMWLRQPCRSTPGRPVQCLPRIRSRFQPPMTHRRIAGRASRSGPVRGHRHINWIGECGGLIIVSAPFPVMQATDDLDNYFYVHALALGMDGKLRLLDAETHFSLTNALGSVSFVQAKAIDIAAKQHPRAC